MTISKNQTLLALTVVLTAIAVLMAAPVHAATDSTDSWDAASYLNDTVPSGDSLFDTIQALKDHITGAVTLTGTEIEAYQLEIANLKSSFGESTEAVNACKDLIDTYDNTPGFGPLFVNTGDFDRNSSANAQSFNWTMLKFMQYFFDELYTSQNLALYEAELDGFLFKSSQKFPGSVQEGAAFVSHTATINASYPQTEGWLRQGDELPARKPTGTYLAAGTIATVTVPQELVGKGYQVRVGAHSWDFEARNRPPVKRFDRCTTLFDIDSTTIKVANPLGGGIYIEVPYLADGGIVTVDIDNVVRSPFFSATSFHTTTLEEWINIERNYPAPWADFQTDKYMCQVPTNWIYALDDPTPGLADWGAAIDTFNDLMGFPRDR
ncbi:MAG: M60 family metallopeptidase, partial [Phycisphaerae bacterium]|nr:M60 family metallopeptidase [Phycisphaerae bacterium]